MSDFDMGNLEEKIEKTIKVLKEEMGTVRAGTRQRGPGRQGYGRVLRNADSS